MKIKMVKIKEEAFKLEASYWVFSASLYQSSLKGRIKKKKWLNEIKRKY